VAGHKVWKQKPAIDLNIPEWGSEYPVTLYNVSEEAQQALPMGFSGRVKLEGRAKEGKDLSKPYNYFWDFIEVVQGDTGDDTVAFPASDGQQPDLMQQAQATKEHGIHKSVALQCAVELWKAAIPTLPEGSVPDTVVLETAQAYFEWLEQE